MNMHTTTCIHVHVYYFDVDGYSLVGAFHSVKPSDMMAELQGRLPVRVELKSLSEADFRKILTETRHNLIEQNIGRSSRTDKTKQPIEGHYYKEVGV